MVGEFVSQSCTLKTGSVKENTQHLVWVPKSIAVQRKTPGTKENSKLREKMVSGAEGASPPTAPHFPECTDHTLLPVGAM